MNHPNRSRRTDAPGRTPQPEEIRSVRERAGLTQRQAGALVYASERAWQEYEGGRRRMHPAIFELLRIKLAS